MNLLLLSNSTSDAGYLTHAREWIREWLSASRHDLSGEALFVPFAGILRSRDDYAALVRQALQPLGLRVRSVHDIEDPLAAIAQARHILVGGGNTFALLHELRRTGLLQAISDRVRSAEASYMGWSAGSNVACPTIRTSNDMPIIDPGGLNAMGLIDWQINAHYTDAHPAGHRGETREERLREFTTLHPQVNVLGLPEGTALRVRGEDWQLLGEAGGRHFRGADQPRWLPAGPLQRG